MPLSAPNDPRRAIAVHGELLTSVFATAVPTLIMSALFAGICGLVTFRAGDFVVSALYGLGLGATIARVAITLLCRAQLRAQPHQALTARTIERRFATVYLVFAAVLGAFGGRIFWLGTEQLDLLVSVLLVGYAAGVSTGVATRPWIAVPAMMLAVLPATLVAASAGDSTLLAVSATFLCLLGGGIRSTLVRYREAVSDIQMRHAFARLARSDPLTGLPNRLALDEHLASPECSQRGATIICVDLDDFKPVNDCCGHLVGDAVLRGVAGKLRLFVEEGGTVARTGGDEFVLVSHTTGQAHQREALCLRIAAAISEPLHVNGEWLSVGASVGSSTLQPGETPGDALSRADDDLYRWKRHRQSIAASAERVRRRA